MYTLSRLELNISILYYFFILSNSLHFYIFLLFRPLFPILFPLPLPCFDVAARLRCYHSFRRIRNAHTRSRPPQGGQEEAPAPRSVRLHKKNMYIELFLLDNFLMNLLTLRAAAAMSSPKNEGQPRRARILLRVPAAAAAAAAGGAMFITLPVKLASTLLMALAFPPHSFRELMHSAAALFLSAAVAGGAVLLAALAFGGTLAAASFTEQFPFAPRFWVPLPSHLCRAASEKSFPGGFETSKSFILNTNSPLRTQTGAKKTNQVMKAKVRE